MYTYMYINLHSVSSITAPQDAHKRLVLQVAEWLTASLSRFKGGARHQSTTLLLLKLYINLHSVLMQHSCYKLNYCIVGNFRGRKLSRIGWKIHLLWRKLSWIACFCHAKGHHAPNFAEKIFVKSHKTAKFTKVFSLESCPYTVTSWVW